MKRIISLLLELVMLVDIVPFQVFAEEEPAKPETEVEENQKPAEKPEENKILQNDAKETEELELGNVIPVNQVGEENSNVSYPLTLKIYNPDNGTFKERTFNSENELLGFGINGGRSDWTYRTYRKIFFGWSIDSKFENSKPSQSMKPDDKIYRDIEPISSIEGLKNDSVLYPIIMPVEDLMAFAKMLETGGGTLYINGEKTEKDVEQEATEKDNFIKRTEGFENKDAEKRLIEYYFDPEKEEYEIQAVSEFYFQDPRVRFVIVENPLGIVKSAKGVTDFTGENPQNYSYEDLIVDLDDRFDVAKQQEEWTFESSTFIVSDVLDENYNSLSPTIALPSPDSLITKFSFENPDGLKRFIIRTTPRSDNSDAKYGSDQSYPTDNTTVVTGQQILQPMKLKTGKISNIKISKEYAKELEADKALESISNGKIRGAVGIDKRRMTGEAAIFAYILPDSQPIPELPSKNTMNFDFAIPIARFDKNTKEFGDAEEQNLGYSKFVVDKAMGNDGFKEDTQPNTDIEKAGEAFINDENYKVNETKLTIGGKEYTFKGWNTQADGKGKFVKADTVIEYKDLNQRTNDNVEEDVTLYAIWEAQEKPQPQPQVKPEKRSGGLKFNFSTEEIEKHIAYIFGYEDNTVRANGNLTRAEAAAMVTRLAKLDLSNRSKADYKDLEDNAWYLPYINAALKAGMLDAENNNLRPNENISRGEFAKMLAAVDKDNDYVSNFSDVKGHKYEKEINKIDGNKRIEGYEDGSFRPDAFLTRAEAATFLNRMHNRVADDIAIESFKNSIAYFKDLNKDDWFYYEIVEASNTHELTRRGSYDKYRREFEKWTNLIRESMINK